MKVHFIALGIISIDGEAETLADIIVVDFKREFLIENSAAVRIRNGTGMAFERFGIGNEGDLDQNTGGIRLQTFDANDCKEKEMIGIGNMSRATF